jgi:hypothetical protein
VNHTFSQQQNQARTAVSSGLVRPNTAAAGARHRAELVPHSSHAPGQQASRRGPLTDAGGRQAGLTGTASPRLGHDFSRIAIQPPPSGDDADRLARAERGVRGPGMPLPAGPRALLEAQFGSRFADVRVHTDESAGNAARQLGAAAYTLGRDIAFGRGFYAPATGRGLRLLAHELTHVVQSRGAPARPLRAGEAAASVGPLEREAERASDALGRGRTDVRGRLAGRLPLCHPVYISGHGDQTYPTEFFKVWGFAPKTGVMSIEAVLRDLAGQPSIDHVSLVSHAAKSFLLMQFLDGGPVEVNKSDWEVTAVSKLIDLEHHVVPESMVNEILTLVGQTKPAELGRIGGAADTWVRQFVWSVTESVYAERTVDRPGHPGWDPELSKKLKDTADAHVAIYRDLVLALRTQAAGAGAGRPSVSGTDFDVIEKAVRDRANRYDWNKVVPPPPYQQIQFEAATRESPTKDIARIALKPDFFDNLSKVQLKVNASSWIEILGCNPGQDPDYLVAVQRFFGGGTLKKPMVTGPDWYQFWGHYSWTGVADTPAAAQEKWQSKDPDVPAALAYWYPIITGGSLPSKPNHLTLLAYMRQGHALPLAIPSAPGKGHILFLAKFEPEAFLEWISRHSYRLTKVAEIRAKLFDPKATAATNISRLPVEWLEEKSSHDSAETKIIFRPSPEYDKHIIKVH